LAAIFYYSEYDLNLSLSSNRGLLRNGVWNVKAEIYLFVYLLMFKWKLLEGILIRLKGNFCYIVILLRKKSRLELGICK